MLQLLLLLPCILVLFVAPACPVSLHTYPAMEWNISKSIIDLWPKNFQQCMNTPDLTKRRPFEAGSLSIIQSLSLGRENEEYDEATNLMACYCRIHGCQAHQNSVDHKRYPYHKRFFTSRWRSVKERFWNSSEWIFGADSDLVPVSFERDIVKEYLSEISPRASVILHARRNREVTASFVGFKSHDKFANCFFEYWNYLGAWAGVNSDNGDLLQAVLEIVFPHLIVGGRCQDNRLLNYYQYMECFGEMFNSFVDSEGSITNSTPSNVGIGPYGVPIKVFMPLEGFWRQYEGPYHKSSPENVELHLLETDTFVHGYKKIGGLFGANDTYYHCDEGSMPKRLGDTDMWWGSDQVLQFASDCCLIRYRGCIQPKNGTMNDLRTNACASERCLATAQGRSGIGLLDRNCSYSKSNLP